MVDSLTIQAKGTTEVFLRSSYDKSVSKSSIWVERRNFYGALDSEQEISSKKKTRRKKNSEDDVPETPEINPYLVIGFDTEFKTPSDPLTRAELYEGKGSMKYSPIRSPVRFLTRPRLSRRSGAVSVILPIRQLMDVSPCPTSSPSPSGRVFRVGPSLRFQG